MLGRDWNDCGLVFPNSIGKPMEPRRINTVFAKLIKKAGLPPETRPHDLRHTAACLLLESGAELFDVSKLLGHSSITITADLYGHLTQGIRRKLAGHMEKVLAQN